MSLLVCLLQLPLLDLGGMVSNKKEFSLIYFNVFRVIFTKPFIYNAILS